jgi:hypothetical protein
LLRSLLVFPSKSFIATNYCCTAVAAGSTLGLLK